MRGGTRCRFHGGKQQQAAQRGDAEIVGGRPATTGVYAKKLIRPEMLEDYLGSAEAIGSLDSELCLARAYLAWAVAQHQANPTGGVAVSMSKSGGSGSGLRIRAYADIVSELTDRVRKLELGRSALEQQRKDPREAGRGALRRLLDRIRSGDGHAAD